MTYLKCTSCKARLYTVARSDRIGGERCPACGATLETVGELVEVVGYRSVELGADAAPPQVGGGVVIHSFAAALAGRRARAAEAALEAERWLDDGGNSGERFVDVSP